MVNQSFTDELTTDMFSPAQVFRGENFIDMHMDKRHSHETDPGASMCLASICGPLHCDFFENARKGKLVNLQTVPCHGRTMDMHKDKCHQLAHQCFPRSAGPAAEHLHAFMMQTFCEAATCRWSRFAPVLHMFACNSSSSTFCHIFVCFGSLEVADGATIVLKRF